MEWDLFGFCVGLYWDLECVGAFEVGRCFFYKFFKQLFTINEILMLKKI